MTYIASFLLVLGALVVFLAALGVLRLPDTFLRMHAATKAGVMGAGIFLLGAGAAMPSGENWLRVIATIVFMLITVPVAAHILGRAAYVAGTPLWRGTRVDQLEGILARGRFDHAPERAVRPSATPVPASGSAAAAPAAHRPGRSDAPPWETATARAAPADRATPQPGVQPIRRIMVGLAGGPGLPATIRYAVGLASARGASVTGLSLIDLPAIQNVGAVPSGALAYARRLVEARSERCREAASTAMSALEAAAAAARIPYTVRHEEGDARQLFEAAARSHDLVVAPFGQWFDHGIADAKAPRESIRRAVLATGDRPDPQAVLFIHDGSTGADETLRWLVQLGLWRELPTRLVGLGRDGDTIRRALTDAETYLRAHDRDAAGIAVVGEVQDIDVRQVLVEGSAVTVIGRSDRGTSASPAVTGLSSALEDRTAFLIQG